MKGIKHIASVLALVGTIGMTAVLTTSCAVSRGPSAEELAAIEAERQRAEVGRAVARVLAVDLVADARPPVFQLLAVLHRRVLLDELAQVRDARDALARLPLPEKILSVGLVPRFRVQPI